MAVKNFLSGLAVMVVIAMVNPVLAGDVPVNSWLADGAYPVSHHHAGQTVSSPVDGPNVGKRLSADEVKSVPLLWSSAPTFKNVNGERIVIAANPAGRNYRCFSRNLKLFVRLFINTGNALTATFFFNKAFNLMPKKYF